MTVFAYRLNSSMNTILNLILKNKIISQKEIIAKSGLAPRTVKNSLKKLKELGYISEVHLFKDLRYKFYKANNKPLLNNTQYPDRDY
ncbi:MAG: winged helix-turn-helix domain-containing protein [Candidatus Methanomethylicia archaeon]